MSVEVKSRKSIPAWIENALEQAEAASQGNPGKTPAVVLHLDGQRYADALVVVRLSDFADMLRNVEAEERGSLPEATQKRMRARGGPIYSDPKKKKDAGEQGALPKRGKRESVTQQGQPA